MQVKQIMKEMIEAGTIHALDIGVLVAPGKTLLANDCVDLG